MHIRKYLNRETGVDAEQLERLIETSPVLVDDVTERVDEGEVLRYLGYPTGRAPGGQIRSEIGCWIEEANQQAEPQAVYVVLPCDRCELHTCNMRR